MSDKRCKKPVIPANAGIQPCITAFEDYRTSDRYCKTLVIPANAGIQLCTTAFEDYRTSDKCCKKPVIPANAGIQWLSTDTAGSPLSYQNARERRYSEFERHALL